MCKKICADKENYLDLWQDVLVYILDYDEQKIVQIHGRNQLKFFVCKIIMNQAHSNTSAYYKQYKHKEKFYLSDITPEKYDYDFDTKLHKTLSEITLYSSLSDDNWYRAELFKLYIEAGSVRKLSANIGIPTMSIHRSITEFKHEIKIRLNENTTNSSITKHNRDKLLEATNATRLHENSKPRN